MDNKAAIPLYLNSNIINNLFTIVVEEFVESKTVTTRNQIVVNLAAPLNELNYEPCKQFTQGDCSIQLLNEFSNQRTEENTSKIINIYLKLKNILQNNGLLKSISDLNDFENIKVNDFVEYTSEFTLEPSYNYVEDIARAIETKKVISKENFDDAENELLNLLKRDIENIRDKRCLRLIAQNIGIGGRDVIVPIELKHMADNIDYLMDSQITVIGKVVKFKEQMRENNDSRKCTRTCLDYMDEEQILKIKEKFLSEELRSNFDENSLKNTNKPFVEIVPFAIYI